MSDLESGENNVITSAGYQMASVESISAAASHTSDGTDRTYSRQLLSGNLRGNQNITGTLTITNPNNNAQDIVIDGTNEAITVINSDGSTVGMGLIPGSSDFGFFSLDKNGKLIMKIINGTKYVYDPSNNYVNVTQDGLLPNGVGGFVAAKPGIDVSTAFS